MKQVLLIYNPNAGNGVIKNHLDQIVSAFGDAGQLIIPYRLGGELSIDSVMTELSVNTYFKIIAAGGDGTINLVVNAMVRNDIHIPLAIFPAGTANDLAGHLGIPQSMDEMIKTALSDNYMSVDVGAAGDRCFVNVLAVGALVDISQRTDPLAKNSLGLAAYYLRGLAEVPFARAERLRVTSKEFQIDSKISAILVMNGRAAGGFKNVAPRSEINDGLLDVIVFRQLTLPTMLPVLLAVMTGQHTNDKRVEYFRTDALRIEAASDAVVDTDLDGERGDPLPLDISVLPGRLQINQ